MHTRSAVALILFSLSVVTACAVQQTAGPAAVVAPPPAAAPAAAPAEKVIPLPLREGSLKFAVLGDFGTGLREQYELADRMAKFHAAFPFELVVMVATMSPSESKEIPANAPPKNASLTLLPSATE